MRQLLFVFGVVLLVAAIGDLLWTTLWVDGGAGPLSSRLMAGAWHGLRVVSDGRSWLLSLAGPLLVVFTFVVWIGLIWAGWTLVFASGDGALIDTYAQDPISWLDLGYFVAYTLFTLGIGDIIPADGVWQVMTMLTTASGMLFITMGVSYVISVLGAVSRKRSFASSVTAIGARGEEFVLNGWNGENFDGFESLLTTLAEEVNYLAYQYKAYPILHYYHTGEDEHATSIAVAIFDEGLTLLHCGVPVEHQPNMAVVKNASSSTRNYLDTLGEAFIQPADHAPPAPDLERLREAGVPTVSDEEFKSTVGEMAERRRRLLGLVETDARQWPSDEV